MRDNAVDVYICDDEQYFLDQVSTTLHELGMEYEVRCNIHTTMSPKSLLQLPPETVDVLFLDIEMPEMDGFTLAQMLRDAGFRTKIIFLTNHREFIQKAFEVNAFRFLFKPCSSQEIRDAMEAALREILESESVLLRGLHDGHKYQIYFHDIFYIESLGEGTAIYTNEHCYTSSNNLRFWKSYLEKDFFKCHRSYLVHLRWIRSISEEDITMYNGAKIPLATRNRVSLKKQFNSFVLKKAGFM